MDGQLLLFMRALSRLLGWTYTIAWSASFYPQPIANWKRKSTYGLAIDFPFLNVVGFTCYTISTSTLLGSSTIRRQYAQRHPYAPEPTVRANDLAFNIHALTLVVLTYSQFYRWIWGFNIPPQQRIGRMTAVITALCCIGVAVVAFIILGQDQDDKATKGPNSWMWLDLIYTIGYVKLVVTFIKYIPQAWLNYQRKSTVGWSIGQILLDLLGGVASILQLVIDAGMQNNWRDVVDNPIKLGLGNISIFFDFVFILQHYVLYRKGRTRLDSQVDDTAEERLLDPDDQQ